MLQDRQKGGGEIFFTFLFSCLFIFSSVRPFPQIFIFLVLISLLVYWAFIRHLAEIPRLIKYITYSFIAIFLTTIPNLFFNDGFSYDHLRSFNLPSAYLIGAVILILMIGLRVSLNQKIIFYTICLSAYINGLIAIVQKNFLHIQRVEGFSGIFEFANLSAISGLCVLAYFFRQQTSVREKIFFGIAFLLVVLTLIFSESRGIMIAFGFACIGIFLLYAFYDNQRRMNLIKQGIVLVLFCLLVGSIFPQVKGSLLRFAEAKSDIEKYEHNKNNVDTSLGLRFEMWKEAWTAFKISPIIGLNPKSLCEYVRFKDSESYERKDCYQRLHNEILNTLARKGILGFLALLSVWVSVGIFFFGYIKSQNNSMQKMIGIAVLGILVFYIIGGAGYEPMSAFMEGNYFLLLIAMFATMLFDINKT